LGFYAATTTAIAIFEFAGSPYAVFEVDPQILQGHSFIAGLEKACGGGKFPEYQAQLKELVAAGSSYTRWAYYVGFVAQTLMQNAVFVVFLAFIYFDKAKLIRSAPYLKDAIFYILGYAVFLGSIWCLFRLTHRNEMTVMFGHASRFAGDYAIVALYGVVLMVFIAYFEFGLEKLAKTLAHLGQFLTFALGVVVVNQNQASIFFGRQASIFNIFVLFLLFVFISAITLAFFLKRYAR
jgi:hypothetical protein